MMSGTALTTDFSPPAMGEGRWSIYFAYPGTGTSLMSRQAAGLVPIVEPEVDIHCPEKAKAEELLRAAIVKKLNDLEDDQLVMLKLTPPEKDDFYADFVRHPKVVRVVALSGGYSREEANKRVRRNHGVVASFSRALVEGLSAQQSDAEFNELLDNSIVTIFQASNT
jgi:fructose-bisphosphate aldolase class I